MRNAEEQAALKAALRNTFIPDHRSAVRLPGTTWEAGNFPGVGSEEPQGHDCSETGLSSSGFKARGLVVLDVLKFQSVLMEPSRALVCALTIVP